MTADEADFIKLETEKIYPRVVKLNSASTLELLRVEFLKLHTAMQRAVIKKFLAQVSGIKDFGFTNFEAVRKVLVNGLAGVELPHNFRADLRRGKLTVRKNLQLKS